MSDMIYLRYLDRLDTCVVQHKTSLDHVAVDMLRRRGDLGANDVHGQILQAQMEDDGNLQNIATWFLDGLGDVAIFQVDDEEFQTYGLDLDGIVKPKKDFH